MRLKKIGCQRTNCSPRCRTCRILCSIDTMTDPRSTSIFAGMDTTSSLLVRILYHLSTHQDVQSKLRQEIVEARNSHGDLEYDELGDLPYLDAVCRETMRLSVLSSLESFGVHLVLTNPFCSDPPVATVSRTYVNPVFHFIFSVIN